MPVPASTCREAEGYGEAPLRQNDQPRTGPTRARFPKRVSLDLSQDDHDALLGARSADRIPMNHRLRALVSIWREDPALAEAVSTRAQELLEPPPGLRAAQPHPTPAPEDDAGTPPAS